MSLAFRTETAELEGRSVTFAVAELGNAVLVLVWEGPEPRWGATTVALPGAASSQVLGDRDTTLGRALGGFLSRRTGKMAVVSTNLGQGYGERFGPALLDLAGRLTEEKKDE